MRVLNRLLAASVATALVGLLIAVVPTSPAHAAAGVHTMNAGVTTVTEGGLADVTISLNVAPFPGETISATVTTVDGSARSGNPVPDYTHKTQTVNFPCSFGNCPTTQTFQVQTLGDASNEPDETIKIVLSNVQGATKGTDGSVTITDDDPGTIPTFTISSVTPSAAEGSGSNATNDRVINVTLSPASDQAVSLQYNTSDDSATTVAAKGAQDYEPVTTTELHWPAGTTGLPTEGAITIKVKEDTFPEPNERFAVNFGAPNNAQLNTAQTFLTITNDDGAAPELTIADAPAKPEGNSATSDMQITVNLSSYPGQTVTVDYSTGDGSAVVEDDYEETKGTLTFTSAAPRTINVPIVGDLAAEQDEAFTVTLSKPVNASLGTPASRSYTIVNDDFGQITTVPGSGRIVDVRLFGPAGAALAGFAAYETGFQNGAHVARGDFFNAAGNPGGDGIDEIIVGPGPNSRPLTKILRASDGAVLSSFLAFDQNFRGGVYVAAGNLDADAGNGDELIVAAGPGGGPHVRVLRVTGASSFNELGSTFAYAPNYHGGVRVTAGDLAGDTRDEIIVGTGPGGGPHIRIVGISAQGQPSLLGEFYAYDPNFSGGVFLAAAGKKLVVAPGQGGGPHIKVFSGVNGTQDGPGFYAYAPDFSGGVSVGAGNLDGDQAPEIVTGAGLYGGPHVKVFELDGSAPFGGGFFAYEPNFTGGIEVAIGNGG